MNSQKVCNLCMSWSDPETQNTWNTIMTLYYLTIVACLFRKHIGLKGFKHTHVLCSVLGIIENKKLKTVLPLRNLWWNNTYNEIKIKLVNERKSWMQDTTQSSKKTQINVIRDYGIWSKEMIKIKSQEYIYQEEC